MVMRKIVIALSMLALSSVAVAQNVAINPDHPDKYTVVKGDTLWDISAKFLRDPWRWPQVWKNNPEIENPHLIYPGDVIYLSYRGGQPVFDIDRAEKRESGSGVVRLSPKIHTQSLDQRAIPTIPMESIRPFLSKSRVVSESELESAGYVLSNAEERLIAGAGDTIYARNLSMTESNDYIVFRPGEKYYDPEDAERPLGTQAIYVATARLVEGSDPSTLRVIESNRELLKSDHLLPMQPQAIVSEILPRAPEEFFEGYIVGLLDGVAKIGQYQVVVLSLGEIDGLEVGHVLSVWKRGDVLEDRHLEEPEMVQLPDILAGTALVFRVFEATSYALIMEARRDMSIYDKVMTP